MKKLYNQINRAGVVFFLSLLCYFSASERATAQLNPLRAIYFNNQYLATPALAGVKEGLNVSLHYRQQWASHPGSPVTQGFAGDYHLGGNAGLGVYLLQEKAGVLSRTKVMGSYAYHLPLDAAGSAMHFGLSMGILNDKVDMDEINGDDADPSVMRYNDRGPYLESELGAAYTGHNLTLQASFPNIRAFFDKGINASNTINRSTFYAAASYKFELGGGAAGLEPKVAMRGMKGYDNIVDVGANLTLVNDQFNMFGMYHSSQSITLGAGVNVLNRFQVTGMYTSGAAGVNSDASTANVSGGFEVGLQARLSKNTK
ncbi:PorP/SprF family type IX secretion system membrane protein [Pontibacter sp. HJ8]